MESRPENVINFFFFNAIASICVLTTIRFKLNYEEFERTKSCQENLDYALNCFSVVFIISLPSYSQFTDRQNSIIQCNEYPYTNKYMHVANENAVKC